MQDGAFLFGDNWSIAQSVELLPLKQVILVRIRVGQQGGDLNGIRPEGKRLLRERQNGWLPEFGEWLETTSRGSVCAGDV